MKDVSKMFAMTYPLRNSSLNLFIPAEKYKITIVACIAYIAYEVSILSPSLL